MNYALLRLSAVCNSLGVCRSTLYMQVSKGLVTKQVITGERSVGWPRHEIQEIVKARVKGQTEEEIMNLVNELHKAREAI